MSNPTRVANDGLAGSIDLGKLSTTGTADATTYLRGDGAWSTVSSGGTNTPSFMAVVGSDQSLSSGSFTKAQLDSELWDTDSAFDHSTNYRFTVPSGKAGIYQFNAGIHIQDHTSGRTQARFYKNGSYVSTSLGVANLRQVHSSTDTTYAFMAWTGNLAEGDYIELYCEQHGGSTEDIKAGTYMSGYKLIT